jgi:hypothetical protein
MKETGGYSFLRWVSPCAAAGRFPLFASSRNGMKEPVQMVLEQLLLDLF